MARLPTELWRQGPRCRRLRIEPLENRCLLAVVLDVSYDALTGPPSNLSLAPLPGPGTLTVRYQNPDSSPGGLFDFLISDGPNYIARGSGIVNGEATSAPTYRGNFNIGVPERVFQIPLTRGSNNPSLAVVEYRPSTNGPTGTDRLIIEYSPSLVTTPTVPPLLSIVSGPNDWNSVSTSFTVSSPGYLVVHNTSIGTFGGGHAIVVDGRGIGFTVHTGSVTPNYYLLDIGAGTHTLTVRHEDDDANNGGVRAADVYFKSAPTVGILVATATGAREITLRWPRTITNGTYHLERASSPNGPFTLIEELPATKTSYVDAGAPLSPSTPYYYRIWAMSNNVPSPYSPIASATTFEVDPLFDPGPRVTSPAFGSFGSLSAPLSFVDVTFSEAINTTSFTASDVTLKRGTSAIPVQQPVDQGNNVWRIPFAPLNTPGAFILIVGPGINDLVGNAMNQDNDSTNGELIADRFVGRFTVQADSTAPVVTLQTPNSGSLQVGDTIQIQGTADDASGISHVWIELYKGGEAAANRVGYIHQGNSGDGNIGSLPWTIPAAIGSHTISGNDYKIKWIAFDGSPNHNAGGDYSDSVLSIAAAPVLSSLVTGRIYYDKNGNGTFDDNAGGFEGLQVTLSGIDSSGSPVLRQAVTDYFGTYVFLDVPPSGANGYAVLTETPGVIRETEPASESSFAIVNVAPNSTARQNFGFVVPLYVITHGLLVTGEPTVWPDDMASAIRQRFGSIDPTILVFDWASRSNTPSPGWAEDAGQELYARVLDYLLRDSVDGPIDVQFIGHSRGAVVNSEAIERLYSFSALGGGSLIRRLQMTMLDPHPWSLAADPDVVVWPHVDWADNYFQQNDYPEGSIIAGAYNVNISLNVGGWNLGTIDHSDVHDWYHWTIDTDDTSGVPTYSSFRLREEEFVFATIGRGSLFDIGPEDELAGKAIGYYWSLEQSGSFPSRRPIPQSARPEIAPQAADVIFNGAFDAFGTEHAGGLVVIPGFRAFTPENGSVPTVTHDGVRLRPMTSTSYLETVPTYLPSGTASLSLEVAADGRPVQGASRLSMSFVELATNVKHAIGQVELRGISSTGIAVELTLPSELRRSMNGVVGMFRFELSPAIAVPLLGSNYSVRLDEIRVNGNLATSLIADTRSNPAGDIQVIGGDAVALAIVQSHADDRDTTERPLLFGSATTMRDVELKEGNESDNSPVRCGETLANLAVNDLRRGIKSKPRTVSNHASSSDNSMVGLGRIRGALIGMFGNAGSEPPRGE